MNTLKFKISITAPAKEIWEVITNKEKYEVWTRETHPGSTFEGEWKKGALMKFTGTEGSGTLVELTELVPASLVKSVHIAALAPGGVEDRESEMALSWIGTTEDYTLIEKDGVTEFLVEMKTTPAWVEMFEESWPMLLNKMKEMFEH